MLKKIIFSILAVGLVLSQELEVEGDLKVQGDILFQDESSLSTGIIVPVGVMMPFAGSEAPDGWLLCYGQEVSREDYSMLFSVVGNTYGDGDGSSTFHLPDLRGRTPIGLDNMGGNSANRVENAVADTLGGGSGEEMHQLSEEEMPAHDHSLQYYITSSSGNYAVIQRGTSTNQPPSNSRTSFEGGDQPHNNMPPYIAINYIIKY